MITTVRLWFAWNPSGACFCWNCEDKHTSFFPEYDECANPAEHGCEHECINTLGGYECQCKIGYELHSDEKRCERKWKNAVSMAQTTVKEPKWYVFPLSSAKPCTAPKSFIHMNDLVSVSVFYLRRSDRNRLILLKTELLTFDIYYILISTLSKLCFRPQFPSSKEA